MRLLPVIVVVPMALKLTLPWLASVPPLPRLTIWLAVCVTPVVCSAWSWARLPTLLPVAL